VDDRHIGQRDPGDRDARDRDARDRDAHDRGAGGGGDGVARDRDAGGVGYGVADGVATITFDRPRTRNAVTFAMRDAFVARLAEAGADPAVRVVVVEGAGGTFTSGVDVGDRPEAQDPSATTFDEDRAEIAATAERWSAMWTLPKPVIVKARGHCVGWGLELALYADVVVASLDCRFFFPSVRNGSGLPDTCLAVYHLGPQWAKRLLLTGDAVDGATAARIGLVLEAVPDEDLDATVAALARRMAALPAALAAEAKAVVNHAVDLMGRVAMQDMAVEANARARRSPEAAEWSRRVRADGLAAAIAWREARRGPE
jgi:enoyl-CoA hydratase